MGNAAARPDDLRFDTMINRGESMSFHLICNVRRQEFVTRSWQKFVTHHTWGLLPELGLFTTLGLGAVLGCMSGTLIGMVVGSFISGCSGNVHEVKLVGNKILITVRGGEPSRVQGEQKIMKDCGAVAVTILGAKPPISAGA
jgi:hypothetical protein